MTLEPLLWLTGLLVILTMAIAFQRNRDPLHPLLYLGPMLFYIYAFVPAVLYYRDLFSERFANEPDLVYAQTVTCVSVLFFCIGILRYRIPAGALHSKPINWNFSPLARKRLLVLSYWFGIIGVGAFIYILVKSGGLSQVYSAPKGGGRADSGYITSAPLFSILAMILYLLSQQGRKMNLKTALILLVLISPHLLHGLLAASRGTTFLALATLVFGWYLTSPKRPSPRVIMAVIVGIGLLMIFLKSQRREIYIGSSLEFNQETFQESLIPSSAESGDTTTYSWGLMLTSRHFNQHYWGRRYAVQLFVRPIPKQLWPTKYEDTGMESMVTSPGSGGMTYSQWLEAVGWVPNAGSATGFIADAYLEFAWGGLAICYLIGTLYGYLWRQSVMKQGIWTIVYFEACIVSVYLPTQGLSSAWAYRFIFLAVPTILIWKLMVSPITDRIRRVFPRSINRDLHGGVQPGSANSVAHQ